MSDTEIIRGIIEESLNEDGKVSKFYVIEEIKNRIHPTRLFNKILTYSSERSDGPTDDGVKNIHLGATKIYRDSIRGLKEYKVIDNFIYRNEERPFRKIPCKIIYDIIPVNGDITKEDLKKQFSNAIQNQNCKITLEDIIEFWDKRNCNKSVSDISDSDKIKQGIGTKFSEGLSYLKRTGQIEISKVGELIKRKVKN